MKHNPIEQTIRNVFERYGKYIATHPRVMVPLLIIGSLVIAGGLGSGMMFIESVKDIEKLYVPGTATSLKDRKTIENLYEKFGDDDLLDYQRTRLGLYGQVLIVPKEGYHDGNVLTVEVLEEALKLHELITDITTEDQEGNYTYRNLCLSWDGKCYANSILELIDYDANNIIKQTITYPFTYRKSSPEQPIFLGTELGGVTFTLKGDVINAAKILQLTYNLRYDSEKEEKQGVLWENEFLREVKRFESESVIVYRRTSHTLEQELDEASKGVVTLLSITFTILITFAIVSCLMLDCVKTKPWLASFGVVSAGLAVLSSFGLMCFLNVPYVNVVGLTPFLILGIGCDNMFVMIAAWRKTETSTTDHREPTPRSPITTKERMPEAFSEAAMSITITSLTNVLAFCIGSITPFASVRYFCAYTGTAVLFAYLYQVTFFAAWMVLTGFREDSNRHWLTLKKVTKHSTNAAYFVCCAGGTAVHPCYPSQQTPGLSQSLNSANRHDRRVPQSLPNDNVTFEPSSSRSNLNGCVPNTEHSSRADNALQHSSDQSKDHFIMLFFKNYFGPFITYKMLLPFIVAVYLLYLAYGFYGIVNLEYGLVLTKLLPDMSYARPYFDLESKYFKGYGPRVSVTVAERVYYWDDETQQSLEDKLTELENSKYFHNDTLLTVSWLRDYLVYLDSNGIVNPPECDFVRILREEFLQTPMFRHYIPDIVFDTKSNDILSSRSYVTFQNVDTAELERKAMIKARDIVSNSSISLIAYHPAFTFFDQYLAIIPNTVLNLGIALVAMVVVSLFLIPHPANALLVGLAITSILIGVMGYMSLWNIALDSISMINLVLCVGFSVDFSAHIMYAFASAPAERLPRDRSIHALYTLGMPITQGAISTILGVIVLISSDSYIFRTFFKIMLLVILFGALHGLVFLPDFLVICSSTCGSCCNHEPSAPQESGNNIEPVEGDRTELSYLTSGGEGANEPCDGGTGKQTNGEVNKGFQNETIQAEP